MRTTYIPERNRERQTDKQRQRQRDGGELEVDSEGWARMLLTLSRMHVSI